MKPFDGVRGRRFLKYGVPFLVLIVGGSFGLKELTSIRYKFRKLQPVTPEVAEKHGIEMKKPGEITLETEFDKIKTEVDIEHWENVRGPRPWEESQSLQKQ